MCRIWAQIAFAMTRSLKSGDLSRVSLVNCSSRNRFKDLRIPTLKAGQYRLNSLSF